MYPLSALTNINSFTSIFLMLFFPCPHSLPLSQPRLLGSKSQTLYNLSLNISVYISKKIKTPRTFRKIP